jgi:hypothetical protein
MAPDLEPPRTDAEPAPPRRLTGTALWIAVSVLAGWGVLTAFMIRFSFTADELHWTRLAWIFSSLEAVAFGAAGALFGTTVQRQRAERAEARADANERDASHGRALAETLVAEGVGGAEDDEPATRTRGSPHAGLPRSDEVNDVARRHATLARSLFPRK